ncbi:unnamed protein product, partial [Allacma fusca]
MEQSDTTTGCGPYGSRQLVAQEIWSFTAWAGRMAFSENFQKNTNRLQEEFCQRAGDWIPEGFHPQRASTPKPMGVQYCVCEKIWSESDPTMVE